MYRTSLALFISFLFLLSIGVLGQTGTIKGRVEDSAKMPVAGASVVLRNKSTGLTRIIVTDIEGRFAFADLGSGGYEIKVTATGFAEVLKDADQATEMAVTLEPEPLRESVTVFSGSRQQELREDLNTTVNVVTRQEIQRTGYTTAGEVLKEVPGVITRIGSDTGTSGGAAGEQIQGIGSRQALVLLDGFPIIAARGIKSGNINLDRQSTTRIEQIEVVKGAASALYGSDAIGGVVNMITREPDKPLSANFELSGGSLGILHESADVGLRKKIYSGFFSFSRDKQNEFDLTPTTWDTTGSGFHRYDVFAKQKLQLTPKFYIAGLANIYTGHARGRSLGEPDPTLGFRSGEESNETRDITQSYGVSGNWSPTPRTVAQLRGYFSRFDEYSKTSFANGRTFPDDNLFQRFGRVDASLLHIWGEHQIIQVGGEWTTDRYRGLNRLVNDAGVQADTKTLWAQDKISAFGRATLTLGFRYDDHSIFGSAWSPKIGLNIRATDRINLRASWGRGFRAPDLGQLYFRFYNPTNFYQVFGKPSLRPEHSGSWQAGAEYSSTKKTYRFGINFFRNDVVNLIEPVNFGFITNANQGRAILLSQGLDPNVYPVRLFRLMLIYNNLASIFTQGVETDFDVKLPKGFAVSGAYTYLDARNKATGAYLPERIKHQAFVKLAYENVEQGLRANVRTSFYSKWRASSLTNRSLQSELESPGFALVDVFVSKDVKRRFQIFATVENLFDNQDPNIGKFNAQGTPLPILRPDAGRLFRFGMRVNFERVQ